MLDLLLRLGTDQGKAILLSTHLLADVDRVCENVVILHQGRVRCFGPVQELCQTRHDRYKLQIQGDSPNFLEELRLEGVELMGDNGRGELRVRVPKDWTTRAFFVLADHHGVLVRSVIRDDENLDELFHRIIGA